jgi:hypothetical protein
MARSGHSCILLAHRIWVIGGFNICRLQSIECYDLTKHTWNTLSSLLHRPLDVPNLLSSSSHSFIIFNGYQDKALPNTHLQEYLIDHKTLILHPSATSTFSNTNGNPLHLINRDNKKTHI